ncbi:bifunctional indole-3-glycerol-phosphate synthase TrpC/phosphoribosylanthranilate isomerase TrpF [Buchnera aphidicola (Ceratovacuna keduensis)]|uniref:bifunctional indole-3-glycerol-phosphate synthase TrpC/phosphoribosylanthranilate isomerase TrpF n=1 Tax=Buchnera aphidicola TaxID=9 RepID=UPI0031B83045
MNKNFLKKILYYKKEYIKKIKKNFPLNEFKHLIKNTNLNFKNCISKKGTSFILEIKKSSPSLGLICKNFNISKIVKCYNKYASAISVITEEKYFNGSLKYLKYVRKHTKLPILCKDFFIDDYQIYLSRFLGADAILLMLSILKDNEYIKFFKIAKSMNLCVLTEVNNKTEIDRAINLKSEIFGINNRNLKDFSIDIKKTKELYKFIPKNNIVISESGISNNSDINYIKKYVNGFLIGSSIMSKNNIDLAIKKIIFGNNKICGITRKKDIIYSSYYGAIYIGIIFVKSSNRYINLKNSRELFFCNSIKYVGVFKNEKIYKIKYISEKFNLHAVQLHGEEDQEYINMLRKVLKKNINIWKAIGINNSIPNLNFNNVNYIILDNIIPGSGKTFNWSLLNKINMKKIFLSGGINIKNLKKALNTKCYGLDLNSGLEKKIGIKDKNKISKIFFKIKNNII